MSFYKVKSIQYLILASLLSLATGCATSDKSPDDLSYLAKSDIDTVADIHRKRSNKLLSELVGKLYKRNPLFCKRNGDSLQYCIDRVVTRDKHWREQKLGQCRGSDCIELAFQEDFSGDRILALATGLQDMLDAAYNNKDSFYFTDELDPQKLYNAARNIEITVWRIANRRSLQGKRYVLTDAIDENRRNLSYERLFGKLISLQDTLSEVIAERDNRRVKNVIQRLATAVFLPI